MSPVYKGSFRSRVFDVLNVTFMCLFCILILYPFLNIFAISLSASGPVLRGDVTFYPKGLDFGAYSMVINNPAIIQAFFNTVYVAVVGCVCSIFFLSLAAYPLAFSDFYGKKVVGFLILFTMWFSGGMIPSFIVMKELHLLNTLNALVLNSLIGAYYVIIMRSYYESIPISLIESAKIDGANDFYILFKIVWPLSKPVIATISLWVIVAHWNDFMSPLIYLKDMEKFTLQVVLRDIVLSSSAAMYEVTGDATGGGAAAIPDQVKDAVLIFSMVPMLILYPFLQKYFVSGIMIGAVKG